MPSEFNLKINGDSSGLVGSIKHSMAALTGLEKKSNKMTKSLGGAFSKLAILATGGLGIKAVQRYGDILVDTKNRLSLVTDGTAQLNFAMNDLFNISIATRSSFEATAIVYSRVALATKEMGKSAEDLGQFTTTMNQAMILSGTKSVEAGQALIQLSQGMASGALRGDELRSVLEQLPYVADLISTELGVTRGELRELGREGKISTDIVFDAMLNNAEKVDEAFKKTTPSISQAANVFETSFLRAFSKLNESIPLVDTMAKSLIVLAENIGVVGRALVAITVLSGGKKGIGGISTVFGLLKKRMTAVFVGTQQVIKVQKTLGVKIAENNKAIATSKFKLAKGIGRAGSHKGQITMRENKNVPLLAAQRKRFKEIEKSTGVAGKSVGKLNVGLAKLANKFPKLNKLMGVFMFGSVAISILVKAVLFLFTTVAGLAIVLSSVVALVVVLSGKITIFKDETTGASVSVLDLFIQMAKGLVKAIPFLDAIKEKFAAFKKLFADPEINRAFVEGFINGVNEGVGNLLIAGEHIRHFFTSLGIVFLNMFDAVFQGIKILINEFIGFANVGLKLVGKDPLKKLSIKSMDKTLFERDEKEKERHEKSILRIKKDQNTEIAKVIVQGGIENTLADMAAQQAKKKAEEASKLKIFYDDILANLNKELELLKMSSREAEVQAFIRKSAEELEGQITDHYKNQLAIAFRRNRAAKEQRALLESITGPEEERVRNNKYLVNLLQEGVISLKQFLKKSIEINESLFKMPKPINSVIQDLKKSNKELSQTPFQNLADQAVEAKKSSEGYQENVKKLVTLFGDLSGAGDEWKKKQFQFVMSNVKLNEEQTETLRLLYEENIVLTEQERLRQRAVQLEESRKQTIEDILNLEKDLIGDLAAFKAAQESLLQGGLTKEELVAYYELERLIKSISNDLFYLQNSQNGVKLGLKQIQEQTELTAESVANELVNAFGHAEDAMVEFFMTGKIGFKEMINAMISDLVRFATQKFIINSIVGGLDNIGSSPTTTGIEGSNPSQPYTPGVSSGMGVKMDSMRSLGAASSSGNGAAPINVTVNQSINSSGQASDQDMLDKVATQTRKAIKETIQTELKEQQRPRNMLNKGMSM